MNMGRSVYLARQGVDGIVDISPFTCMNGVVSEAIYPKVSRDCGGVPIRNFYFDGQHSDLDRDIGIYLELVRTYRSASRIRVLSQRVGPRPEPDTQPGISLHTCG